MKRNAGWLLVVVTLALTASTAQAAGMWSFMLGGGMSVPTGKFGDESKSGPNVGGSVDYSLTDLVTVGVDGTWNSNEHKDVGVAETIPGGTYTLTEDKFTIVQLGAHAHFMVPMSGPVKTYGLLGAGIYNLKEKYTYTFDDGSSVVTLTEEDDEASGFFEQIGSRMGGKVGAGALYPVTEQIGVGLEVCLNVVTLDKDKTGESSAQYVGVHGGIMFHIMPK